MERVVNTVCGFYQPKVPTELSILIDKFSMRRRHMWLAEKMYKQKKRPERNASSMNDADSANQKCLWN